MLNIIRMDLHRFRTNRVIPLLLLVFCAFQLFGIFMMKQYDQPDAEGELLLAAMNASEFMQYTISQPPSWLLLYIAVFTVYFYMSEYSSGFYKNYMTMRHARVHSILSKVFIQALFTCCMFAALVVSDLVGRSLFFGNGAIGDVSTFVRLLGGQWLLHWAFSVLILLIATLTRSMLVSLIVSLVLSLNVIGMALAALESLLGVSSLSRYLLVNTIVGDLDYGSAGALYHAGGVAAVSLLLFTAAAAAWKKREDLR